MSKLSVDAFFSDAAPADGASLEGSALVSAYWRTRALRDEVARKERYWSSLCDALASAYEELERATRELETARVAQLAARVERESRELLSVAQLRVSEPAPLVPGMLLGGRTRVLEPLGEGGSSIVYRASDELLGGDLAVKVLRRPQDRDAALRLIAEAGATSRVAHPAIVRPLRLDLSEDGVPYILMERVEGRSLHAHLVTFGPLALGALCRLGSVLGQALAAAHDAGLVHRDVKPGNLMITGKAPGLRVLDFGIARALTGDVGAPGSRGRLVGTPAYVSPEQIRDADSASAASDVFSAGATLFEAITGRAPFRALTPERLAREPVAAVFDRLRSLAPHAPAVLSELVGAALEEAPENRPTARELGRRLDAIGDELGALPVTVEASRLLMPRGDETC